ncbi:MAG TPA: SusC/RagA family TonB-linked outer membrane protein [Flavisolibacter sp.]|nr:SusC/RagA family TonB-linked outer membrane protein [Flavisolibacter sp.]
MKKERLFLLSCLLLFVQVLYAQNRISGKVTSESGVPLSGATVTLKNTNTAVVTDAAGNFSITVNGRTTLVVTYSGYQTLERIVDGATATDVDISLRASEGALTEVIVTGYTTQTRRQAPGSISRVRADEVRLQPLGSFEQQLQGKSPGVLIQSASGQPGSAASVTIRGKGSVLGSTEPLYIVDGIQITAQDFRSINPSDFETYNILKDAVATAQYGSRGANGVIVITTKRGANGKTRLSYDYQYGLGQLPTNKIQLMNSKEKIDFELAADGIYGLNPNGWSPQEADSLSKVNADWNKALFREQTTNQHQLSLSGGTDRTKFFLSGSVFKQQGVVLKTGLDRYTGRINVDHTAGDFKVGLNAFVGSSNFRNTNENNAGIGSPLNAIRWHLPYVTPYLADGSYNQADMAIQGQPNALQELIENPGNIKQLKSISAVTVEYKAPFIAGLTARTNWGVDYTENLSQRYINPVTYLGSQQTGTKGSYATDLGRNVRYTGTTSLGYRKQTGDNTFGINLFNEIIRRKASSFGYTGYGLIGPLRNGAGITPGSPTNGFIPALRSNETELALLSYFAIADYSLKNKYFFNGTVRRDGSSKLAEGKKWTTFGGAGVSWVVSSEDFMRSSAFNDLKLKVSYGSAANSNVGDDYEALEQFGPVSYNGVGGLVLNNIKKPDLTWEIRKTFNAGIEFGILKSRVSGTVEYYNGITSGLYLNRQISGTNGVTAILTNIGKLRNRGIEGSLNLAILRPAARDGLTWNLVANHTYNQSKILELDGQDDNISGLSINRVNEIQNSIYVVRYAGVNPQTGVSQYLDKDGKITEVYDPNDRVIAGKYDPPHFGGVTNTLSYKGIEASVLFTYVFGNKVYNNDRTNVENPGYYYSSMSNVMLRAWKKAGDITDIPGLLDDYHPETTRYVEDGKFLRLRNVMLSYGLPSSVASRIKATSIRVFAQGQNLVTWHNVQSYDPEGTGFLTGSVYPALRTYTFGLSVGF